MNSDQKKGLILFFLSFVFLTAACVLFGVAIYQTRWYSNPIMLLFSPFYLLGFGGISIICFIFVIKKAKKEFNLEKLHYVLISLLMVLPVAGLFTFGLVDRHVYNVRYTFTTEKWALADQNERGRLIDSFRKIHAPMGKDKAFIEELLGTPDVTFQTDDNYYYEYHLGDYKHWIAVDVYSYRVRFDSMNVIISENIYQG